MTARERLKKAGAELVKLGNALSAVAEHGSERDAQAWIAVVHPVLSPLVDRLHPFVVALHDALSREPDA